MRDNFSDSIRQSLAKQVNYRCSVCDAQTSGPRTGTVKPFSIGKAAHIKAAASGGPRYDPNQTSEERASFENDQWACANCADIIDRNDSAYTVEQLVKIKEEAEQRAEARVGVIPAESTAIRPIPTSIKRAIQQYCLVEEARHEDMDPRFTVSVGWENGKPVYSFGANEPVDAQLVYSGNSNARPVTEFREFVEYGGSLSFEGGDVRLEGSPVFNDGGGASSGLRLATKAVSTLLTVMLGEEDDVPLNIEFGEKAAADRRALSSKAQVCTVWRKQLLPSISEFARPISACDSTSLSGQRSMF